MVMENIIIVMMLMMMIVRPWQERVGRGSGRQYRGCGCFQYTHYEPFPHNYGHIHRMLFLQYDGCSSSSEYTPPLHRCDSSSSCTM